MKLCKACSAYNSDDRTHCVDCGQRLGSPLSQEESAALESQLKEQTERMFNRNDPTHVNGYDLVIGGLHIIGLLAVLVLWPFGLVREGAVGFVLAAVFLFGYGMAECFAPRFLWETVAWYRSFWTHDTEPLISASLARRMLETVALAVGVALTLWSVLG